MISEKYIAQFQSFAKRHNLFDSSGKVLLAISGGVDSVVMGWLFHQVGVPFGVAHCNFKLRSDASDGDEQFVKALAMRWQVPFFSRSFSTKAYAGQRGVSTQMAARELRYNFFEEIQQEKHYQKLATAHHIDDALETMLINIAHGTGFQGVACLPPHAGKTIRPMLAFSRADIMQIAVESQVDWREDASNDSDDYERNKIRHHVTPVLRQLNPSLSGTLMDTMERLWAAGEVINDAVAGWEGQFLKTEGSTIEIQPAGLMGSSRLLLFESLKKHTGLGYKVFKQLQSAIDAGVPGKVFYTDSHVINVDRGKLVVCLHAGAEPIEAIPVPWDTESISLPHGTLVLAHKVAPINIEKSENVALLDSDKLTFPLEIRSWRQGDSFMPLGMRGQKKLSDFMIDSKIPVNLKQRVLVLVSAGKIAWVIGHRIDDRFKIAAGTRNVLRLELC